MNNARMDSHEPDFIVVGDRVALGPLRRDLAAVYARWMNDPAVRDGLNQMGVAPRESQEKWVEENLERGAHSEPEVVEFTVYDRTDSAPIGTAGLMSILHAHGTAPVVAGMSATRELRRRMRTASLLGRSK